MRDTIHSRPSTGQRNASKLRGKGSLMRHPAEARTAHSLLRRLGLNHLESVNHYSNHHANNGENDGPLDEFFLQSFLSKRLMII